MTDQITDQDRRAARQWAEDIYEMSKYDDETPRETRAAVKCIFATVDAPTTLSEELANITEHWEEWATDMITVALAAATDRAKQMEHDLTEALAKVEQAEDRAAEWQGIAQRDYAKVELLTGDLAEARAEVDHLKRYLTEAYKTRDARDDEVDRLRAEVERLTDVNETLLRTNNFKGFRERLADVQKQLADVQKGAESNAESLGPADVKPGEAWLIKVDGRTAVGVRDGVGPTPEWSIIDIDYGGGSRDFDYTVTLVSRLVPAPRVITNPDELDRLPHSSVILSADNDAWQKSSETSLWASAWWTTSDGEPSMWPSDCLCDEDHPATVLWEQEA